MNQTITEDDRQSPAKENEDELVQAAQQNPARFDALYTRWLKPVYRYFYFRAGNVKDAEDLTSQVFLQVYRDLPRYHQRGAFSAWLFSIAHARLVDHYRRNSHHSTQEIPFEKLEIQGAGSDPSTQTIQKADIEQVIKLLNNLDEKGQGLIRLRFMAELSYREIGQILHCKEDTARKSVARLLDRFKQQMENENDQAN
ncbi:MAG: sigma-70 family RNA polymerase sigma factor [Anaerolineae bacterium]|nr:sigma-70 family RNA polymerase sigma factor [Anaerolineae bacterium]